MEVKYSFPSEFMLGPAWKVTDSTIEYKKMGKVRAIPFEEITSLNMFCGGNGVFEIKTPSKNHTLYFVKNKWDKAYEAFEYVLAKSPTAMEEMLKEIADDEARKRELQADYAEAVRKFGSNSSSQKDASVVGRAVAGAVIAGPAGAVVGALSAVDKNMRNKK